jgi:hypothetical protein
VVINRILIAILMVKNILMKSEMEMKNRALGTRGKERVCLNLSMS